MKSVAELAIGRELRCRGAVCGVVTFVVWDPSRGKATFLVVQGADGGGARMVPVRRAFPAPDWMEFDGTPADFRGLEAADGQVSPALDDVGGVLLDRSDHVLVRVAQAGRGVGGLSLQPA